MPRALVRDTFRRPCQSNCGNRSNNTCIPFPTRLIRSSAKLISRRSIAFISSATGRIFVDIKRSAAKKAPLKTSWAKARRTDNLRGQAVGRSTIISKTARRDWDRKTFFPRKRGRHSRKYRSLSARKWCLFMITTQRAVRTAIVNAGFILHNRPGVCS